jgi:hypothetical protein
VTDDTIASARRWFAEELRHTAHVRSASVVDAFATVPKEHFARPGPWRILSPMHLAEHWTTEDADPRHRFARCGGRRTNRMRPVGWPAKGGGYRVGLLLEPANM